MKRRAGLTVVEMLVVIVILGLCLAVVLPAVNAAREAARRRQCANNLRQFGIALASYHDALRTFPPGLIAKFDRAGLDEYAGANSMLLPYFEQTGLHALYDPNRAWYQQTPQVARTVVPIFVCPSVRQKNPFEIPLLASYAEVTTGSTYAVTNYLFSKGLNDAWCSAPESVPANERGMFDINFSMRDVGVRDGLANTMAMGEGAGGADWPLCFGPGCSTAAQADPAGNDLHAGVPWLASTVYPDFIAGSGYLASSHHACALEPLNKKPVTHSMVAATAIADCRCSADGGPHHTSNFRSDHPGGGNFLFADGAVHFLQQSIDMTTYARLSTVAEGTVAELQ